MGDFSKNPKTPFEIWCPNKIRKRIAMQMHETKDSAVWKLIRSLSAPRPKILLPKTLAPKRRGSLWSRFAGGVANILNIKPGGIRE